MNHLVVFDFDRTIADTFTPAPSGVGVKEAYDMAIYDVFGQRGFDAYHEELGGLQGREPKELVLELLKSPRGLKPQRNWSVSQTIEHLVAVKLDCLLAQITPKWPRLYDGAKDFFEAVEEKVLPIDLAIISSGHDEFIRWTFEVNKLIAPQNLVTSDTVRTVTQPERELYKPHPYQLARAHYDWLKKYGESPFSQNGLFTERDKGKPQILYVGDDPKIDGELARNARIPFGFVPFSHPDFIPDEQKGQLLIPDFYFLKDVLEGNRRELLEGKSFSEIMFDKPDHELFPPISHQERPYQQWMEKIRANPSSKERF